MRLVEQARTRFAHMPVARARDGAEVTLRAATAEDVELLFRWQTPELRRYFRNAAAPTWEEHQAWMSRVLVNPDRLVMVVSHGDRPVGYVRFDAIEGTDRRLDVSVLIGPEGQGLGVSTPALGLACALLPDWTMESEVRAANVPSIRMVVANGFQHDHGDLYIRPGQPVEDPSI